MNETDKQIFISIAKEYYGEIIEELNRVYIKANNEICSYYTSGEIHTKKKVECIIGLDKNRLFGEEKTFAILGGFGGLNFSPEKLIAELKRFGFKKKTNQQISFF